LEIDTATADLTDDIYLRDWLSTTKNTIVLNAYKNGREKLNELYANPNMHDFAIFCLWFTMFFTPTIVSTSLLVMGVDPAVNFAVTSSFVFVPLFCITAIDLAYKYMRIRNE
jgi:hypothetical protein